MDNKIKCEKTWRESNWLWITLHVFRLKKTVYWIVGLQYVFNNYSSAGSSVVFSFGGITSEKIKNVINAATKPGTIGWLK